MLFVVAQSIGAPNDFVAPIVAIFGVPIGAIFGAPIGSSIIRRDGIIMFVACSDHKYPYHTTRPSLPISAR